MYACQGVLSFCEIKEDERFRGGVPIGTPHKIIVKSGAEIAKNGRSSMTEMPHSGEYHRYTMFIGSLDDLFITYAAARLDNGGNTGLGSCIDTVPEGEEGV